MYDRYSIKGKISIVVLFFLMVSSVYGAEEESSMKKAYFAGGCFWCMEAPFEKLEGVSEVLSGYTGGKELNPTYKQVANGRTSHYEAVVVVYDEEKITYKELLQVFWRQIDPTDGGGQFADRGNHYATAIFYTSEEEKRLAEESKAFLQKSGWFNRPIVTKIIPFDIFYVAEEYHQDYYKTNALSYKFYRAGSGRDKFLNRVWGEEADDTDEIPKKP